VREAPPSIDETVAATPMGRAPGAASIALDDEARVARRVAAGGLPLFEDGEGGSLAP